MIMTHVIIFALLIVIAVGMMVSAIRLKTKLVIPRWMDKDGIVTANSDVKGFADYMWLKTIAGAVIILMYALYYYMAQTIEEIVYGSYVPITFIVILMAYMIILNGAKDRFLRKN